MRIKFTPTEYLVEARGLEERLVIERNGPDAGWDVVRENGESESFSSLAEAEDRATEIVQEEVAAVS